MAEELKPDGNNPPTKPDENTEKEVTLTQGKLDSLINEKFKKGAEKANHSFLEELGVESLDAAKEIIKAKAEADDAAKTELEKANELAQTTAREKQELQDKYEALQNSNAITTIAAKHGITETAYFQLEYDQAKGKEGFDIEKFIVGLKESKPLLFGKPATPAATDNSKNTPADPNDISSKIKGMTMNELRAYQMSIS